MKGLCIVFFLFCISALQASDSKWGMSLDISGGINKTIIKTSLLPTKAYISYGYGLNAFYQLKKSNTYLKSGIYFGEKSELFENSNFTDNFGNVLFKGAFIQKYQNFHYSLRLMQRLGTKNEFFIEAGPNLSSLYKTRFKVINRTEKKVYRKGENGLDIKSSGFGVDIGMGISKPVSNRFQLNLGILGYWSQMNFIFNNTPIYHLGANLKSELVYSF